MLKRVVVFLVSLMSITGIGFIDNALWDVFFVVIGMIAYAVVGFLFAVGILTTKQAGAQAYVISFVCLLAFGIWIYNKILKFKAWLLSWPGFIKGIVLVGFGLLIVIFVFLMIIEKKSINKKIEPPS